MVETGIDYLRLVKDARDAQRTHEIVNFTALTRPIDADDDQTKDAIR